MYDRRGTTSGHCAVGGLLRAAPDIGLEPRPAFDNLRGMIWTMIPRHRFGTDVLLVLVRKLEAALAGLPVTDMIFAALLVLPTSAVVWAEGRLQDWIPSVLTMPEDAEVVKDRAIGSTVRMLSITTDADVDALFAEWKEKLETNGYAIARVEGDSLENAIEFSGPGISNAKIILAPTTEGGRNIIMFDATLE